MKCPSSIEVKKEECKEAGLALGGTLINGAVAVGNWNNAPGGCSFGPNIQYNKNADGVSDGLWHSICHKMKGVVQVPVSVEVHACPRDKTVSENDCLAAGLTAGAYKNGVIQGSWNDKPSGCFIDKIGSRSIYFNQNTNPDQLSKNDDISLLCQWECPQPHLTQHEQNFGCQCKDGYVSRATGEQLLQDDDDECISSPKKRWLTNSKV